ncbi:MAG: response regulator, partial [Cyanobacteria bacterium J06626_14]
LIEAILDDAEYHVTCAQNGSEALEQVNLTPPDVILLDVSMPDMSGIEVTEQIRQNDSLPYIPILLVTANDSDICRQGLETGADGYIRKPFNIRELEAKVKSLLQLNRFMGRRSMCQEANA